ncbi:MAG: universal stress protein [Rhodospirillaceae bacterium]|nr:universal stress protein [Rhodospirillaceae bacterium]
MEYKDIVVHLGTDNRSAARLDAAIELAEHYEGRVTGVYVLSKRNIPGFVRCEIPPEILKRLDTEERTFAEEAETHFAERTARTPVPCEWRLMTGDPVEAVTTSAHYADITIVGQTDPDDGRTVNGLADGVVLGGGGPVLVWPYVGSCHVTAATIMLAWNGTREATRALADALPLMQQARKVIVFGVDRNDGKHVPGADISTHLAHHGVWAEARHTRTSSGIHIGDALLSEIGDCGIGLLVMGGYGHHRLRERLFGGVTRDILREMTVPVLMAH